MAFVLQDADSGERNKVEKGNRYVIPSEYSAEFYYFHSVKTLYYVTLFFQNIPKE